MKKLEMLLLRNNLRHKSGERVECLKVDRDPMCLDLENCNERIDDGGDYVQSLGFFRVVLLWNS